MDEDAPQVLIPAPCICGLDVAYVERVRRGFQVICDNCGRSGPWRDTEHDATRDWNEDLEA